MLETAKLSDGADRSSARSACACKVSGYSATGNTPLARSGCIDSACVKIKIPLGRTWCRQFRLFATTGSRSPPMVITPTGRTSQHNCVAALRNVAAQVTQYSTLLWLSRASAATGAARPKVRGQGQDARTKSVCRTMCCRGLRGRIEA